MQWLILVQGYISSKSKETKFFISVLKLITLEDFYAWWIHSACRHLVQISYASSFGKNPVLHVLRLLRKCKRDFTIYCWPVTLRRAAPTLGVSLQLPSRDMFPFSESLRSSQVFKHLRKIAKIKRGTIREAGKREKCVWRHSRGWREFVSVVPSAARETAKLMKLTLTPSLVMHSVLAEVMALQGTKSSCRSPLFFADHCLVEGQSLLRPGAFLRDIHFPPFFERDERALREGNPGQTG